MKILRTAIAGILALVTATAALAQTFPSVPDRTVIGRIGTGSGSGPSQAIPFATLAAQLNTMTVGVTTVTGGVSGRVLYDNGGLLGEYLITGTGLVVMQTSPQLITPNIGAATGTSLVLSGTDTPLQLGSTTTTTSGLSRKIQLYGSDNGTGAGTFISGNNGANTMWGIGTFSTGLGGSYDDTLAVFQRNKAWRFSNGLGAGLGAGIYASLDEVASSWRCERRFDPKIGSDERDGKYAGWKEAVGRVLTQR